MHQERCLNRCAITCPQFICKRNHFSVLLKSVVDFELLYQIHIWIFNLEQRQQCQTEPPMQEYPVARLYYTELLLFVQRTAVFLAHGFNVARLNPPNGCLHWCILGFNNLRHFNLKFAVSSVNWNYGSPLVFPVISLQILPSVWSLSERLKICLYRSCSGNDLGLCFGLSHPKGYKRTSAKVSWKASALLKQVDKFC